MKKIIFIMVAFCMFITICFAQIPTNGLFAYYPFSGNANDMSGNNYNGTLHGPVLTTDRFGNLNSAYSFDGINDYIDLNNYVSSFNIQQPVTVSFWIKTNTDTPQAIYSLSGTSTQGYSDCIWVGGDISSTLTNELIDATHNTSVSDYYIAGYISANRALVINNNWHHIVYEFNNVSTVIYLDNNLLILSCNYGTNNGHYGNIPSATLNLLGVRYFNGYGCYVNGALDDIRFYNRELSPTEITALFQEVPCAASVPHVNGVSICGGGVTTLTASNGINYIWYNSSGIQIASGQTYTTPFLMSSTTYYVTNFDGTCESLRDTVIVTINPLPVVSINLTSNFININANTISLTGNPSGGSFSGNGVTGNSFNPTSAGLGTSIVSYFYTDGNGCSRTINNSVIVYDTTGTICTDTIYISVTDTLIIDVLLSVNPPYNINTIKIYPNPTHDVVFINTGNYSNMINYSIKIENNIGQIVYQTFTNQQLFQINVNDFGGYGIYFVKIINDTGNVITTRKIVLL